MNDGMLHPTPDRLEAYVEGSLDDSDRAVLESHIVSCTRCQVEVDEWRAIFAALAALPAIEPSAGFVDRVMAEVHVHRPWMVRVADLLRRLVPTSPVGWLVTMTILSLPLLVGGSTLAWILSRPTITPTGLALFVRDRVGDALLSLSGRVLLMIMENDTALGLWTSAKSLLANVSAAKLGAAAAMFAVLMVVSLWVLYDNLFRTSTREEHYVMRCY
jgi:anti-sigma factor RsiW